MDPESTTILHPTPLPQQPGSTTAVVGDRHVARHSISLAAATVCRHGRCAFSRLPPLPGWSPSPTPRPSIPPPPLPLPPFLPSSPCSPTLDSPFSQAFVYRSARDISRRERIIGQGWKVPLSAPRGSRLFVHSPVPVSRDKERTVARAASRRDETARKHGRPSRPAPLFPPNGPLPILSYKGSHE